MSHFWDLALQTDEQAEPNPFDTSYYGVSSKQVN